MYTYSFLNIYLFPKTHSMLESALPRKDERMDILPYINLSVHSDIATISKMETHRTLQRQFFPLQNHLLH